jgi:hypothetical protein
MVAFCSEAVRVAQRSSVRAEATSEARRSLYLAFLPICDGFLIPLGDIPEKTCVDLVGVDRVNEGLG